MDYQFSSIEEKWQRIWKEKQVYKVSNQSEKPKCYVLDMFPYPSGAGLHVGHPLGYIASDIYARYKKLKGFNVLHPMGYDAFGLPAEQYAIEHGIHPEVSTEQNIRNFRQQMDNIGFCFDWDREIRTSDPSYYKWTQWIFLQLFKSYYDRQKGKAMPIEGLIASFGSEGNHSHPFPNDKYATPNGTNSFTGAEWASFDEKTQQEILMQYRLAYCGYGEVNWCEALGTVLANDEVVNGVSERGGYPVVRKRLRQWYLRITEYADRLLAGLEQVEFSDALKEMQTNWIGKSSGAEIDFEVKSEQGEVKTLRVYTTRPDTIFGVDFMVIAPELDIVLDLASAEQKSAVDNYLEYVGSRSERERMAEKKISGVFTGSYALNPFDGREIPIWISEYVLAGYGTGAIMAVPCGDERDHKFARHFGIPISNIIGKHYDGEEANPTKDAVLENSGFLDGTPMRKAVDLVIDELEKRGIGTRKTNYKMRDAAFSRQRYWGEPFPIQWIDGIAYPLDEKDLPLQLPKVDTYGPGPEGEGPLANLESWTSRQLETNTMPGYAGSSWYFLRYMDPHNDQEFCNPEVSDYWGQVDLYIGGTEHAVGHLLYSRMWTKALFDLGYIGFDEPYKKLLNQGMITGRSYFFAVKTSEDGKTAVQSYDPKDETFTFQRLKYGHTIVDNDGRLLKERYDAAVNADRIPPATFPIQWEKDGDTAFIYVKEESEKMSKSKFNVDNPDDLIARYGADTFRLYEMFLGPVEMSKPWDTKGIEGVMRFFKKFWRLFYDDNGPRWNDDKASPDELKVLHRSIKKIGEDTERFSFNTAVSTFMIATNELTDLKCHKKEILLPLLILLQPYAPHITEELYSALMPGKSLLSGGEGISGASYPVLEEKYLVESSKEYPVSVNGKLRTTMQISLDATAEQVEALVLENEAVQKWIDGKPVKRLIFVKGKMINIVV